MGGWVKLWSCPECAFSFDNIHKNESGGYTCPLCVNIRLREVLNKRDAEIQELMDIFRHTHVACKPGHIDPPGYPDQCQECGLDIRDAIHTRIALAASTDDE